MDGKLDPDRLQNFFRRKKKAYDLNPWSGNPREIASDNLKSLAFSLEEFGDLSSVVYNVRTDRIVCGHQRMKNIPDGARIEVDEIKSDDKGTVALGHMKAFGTVWRVRFVDWDVIKEKAANIAANSPELQGQFVQDKLDSMVSELRSKIPSESEKLRFVSLIEKENKQGKKQIVQRVPQKPTKMLWVLVGVPVAKVQKALDHLSKLEGMEGVFYESTVRELGENE